MKIQEILTEGMVQELCKRYGLTKVANSIGYSEKKDRWYGWSHRAVCSFGKGEKIFEPNYGDEKTKFTEHGKKTIKSDEDMQKAAKAFAKYVS